MRRFALLLAVCLLPAYSSANAAPIKTIDGTIASFTLSSNSSAFTLSFTGPTITQHNGVLVGPLPATIATFSGSATPIFSNSSFTVYGLTAPAGVDKTINPLSGGQAAFNITSLTFSVLNALPNVGVINGSETLLTNTTAYDYSPFSNGGLFTFTLNVSPGGNLNTDIQSGGSFTGSGSFSQVALDPAVPAVPEPSTFIMAAMFVGLLGGGLMLRRRANRGEAALAV